MSGYVMSYLYYRSLHDAEWAIHGIYDDEEAARKAGRLLWKETSIRAIRIDNVTTVVMATK